MRTMQTQMSPVFEYLIYSIEVDIIDEKYLLKFTVFKEV
jgi:hypothetical protein